MAETEPKKIVVRVELDPETHSWVAVADTKGLPRKLVTQGIHRAAGNDAAQALNRLTRELEGAYRESYPDEEPIAFEAEPDVIPPTPALRQRVAEFRANELERQRLEKWLIENRVPLANELIQQRIPQNLTALLLLCTPTWLGMELKKAALGFVRGGTGKTNKTSKTPLSKR